MNRTNSPKRPLGFRKDSSRTQGFPFRRAFCYFTDPWISVLRERFSRSHISPQRFPTNKLHEDRPAETDASALPEAEWNSKTVRTRSCKTVFIMSFTAKFRRLKSGSPSGETASGRSSRLHNTPILTKVNELSSASKSVPLAPVGFLSILSGPKSRSFQYPTKSVGLDDIVRSRTSLPTQLAVVPEHRSHSSRFAYRLGANRRCLREFRHVAGRRCGGERMDRPF
jgi:hypothetical protein